MKTAFHKASAILLAAFGGFLIWELSPLILGEKEPWDFPSLLPYLGSLFGVGIIAGGLFRGAVFLPSLGITGAVIVGQLGFMFFEGSSRYAPLWGLGLVTLFACSLCTFVGALIGSSFMAGVREGNGRQSATPAS